METEFVLVIANSKQNCNILDFCKLHQNDENVTCIAVGFVFYSSCPSSAAVLWYQVDAWMPLSFPRFHLGVQECVWWSCWILQTQIHPSDLQEQKVDQNKSKGLVLWLGQKHIGLHSTNWPLPHTWIKIHSLNLCGNLNTLLASLTRNTHRSRNTSCIPPLNNCQCNHFCVYRNQNQKKYTNEVRILYIGLTRILTAILA